MITGSMSEWAVQKLNNWQLPVFVAKLKTREQTQH